MSSVATVVVSLPAKITTTTSVSASATQLTVGQTLTLSISVAPQSGSGAPTGSVTILDGTTQIGAPALSAGAVSFSTSTLAAGSHSIKVNYSGDSNFSASTSAAIAVTVSAPAKVNTNSSLSESSTQIVAGSSVTFTASVAPASGTATPTGTISFLDSSASLGAATLSGGSAQLTTAALAVGTHSIRAAYSGDSNFAPSTSAVATITVSPAPTADYSLSVSTSSLSVAAGASGKLTLTVTPEIGFKQVVSFTCSGLPTGANCSFNPQSVTPAGAAVSSALTIQVPQASPATVASPNLLARNLSGVSGSGVGLLSVRFVACQIFAFVVLGILPAVRKQDWSQSKFGRARASQALAGAALFAVVSVVGGCASAHTLLTTTPMPAAQTYTVTITASGTNAPSHSQSITLTVRL